MKKDGAGKEKEDDCGEDKSCRIIVLTGKPKSTKLENFRGC